jgi:hypothetical protein
VPQKFKDYEGREWTVFVSVDEVRKVRREYGVYLPGLVENNFAPLDALARDVVQFIDVLYLCTDAGAKGCSPGQFGRAISGDVVEAAGRAFMEALVDFFPDARRRALLRDVLAKGKRLGELVREKAAKELGKVDPERAAAKAIRRIDAAIREAEAKEEKELAALLTPPSENRSNGSSGSVPASPESTPAPSPSAS